jgi:cell division protein FtsB
VLEESAKRGFLIFLLIALFYVLFFGEDGIFAYIRLKKEIKDNVARMRVIEEENLKMKRELERLKNDKEYLEEIVRKKYGLIREGEKVYRFEP